MRRLCVAAEQETGRRSIGEKTVRGRRARKRKIVLEVIRFGIAGEQETGRDFYN